MIRVVVVDDHPLVRTGLSTLLGAAPDVEVVGQAADGAAALELDVEADVVLMDLSMPGLDGVQATRALAEREPGPKVVILTSFGDRARVRDAVAAGAVGYVLKDCAPEELLAAVRSAADGHNPFDARVTGALLPERGPVEPGPGLSAREVEVLRLAATGMPNKQIARSLGIAERTVKVHLGNVFRRIGVRDRTSAALWAREHLPDPPGTGPVSGVTR